MYEKVSLDKNYHFGDFLINLPITKAHVENKKSFPFGHLCRSFLTLKSADWEPRWLPDPLELLTSAGLAPLGIPLPLE